MILPSCSRTSSLSSSVHPLVNRHRDLRERSELSFDQVQVQVRVLFQVLYSRQVPAQVQRNAYLAVSLATWSASGCVRGEPGGGHGGRKRGQTRLQVCENDTNTCTFASNDRYINVPSDCPCLKASRRGGHASQGNEVHGFRREAL
jgi:hypothetical protein